MYDRSKPPTGPRRHRGRPQARRGSGPNQTFESNGGPGIKVRGTARQVAERYHGLARDALSSGDRIAAENFLQHAEHYQRIQATLNAPTPTNQARSNGRADRRHEGESRPHGDEPLPVDGPFR
ncbi:MAG: DUF4167 domain-containing protein [Rhodospirillales bacterium]|nr:DUF4167 domain-containing protein [Alphaproteobacteria bacterium]MCY4430359.1 DUF4167 domain-containing protein [Rhodospirillales bacterium]